jgi:hypothetical protein
MFRERENSTMARIAPSMPPWNDMPPCHSATMSRGLLEIAAEIVEQDIAQPPAEHDAERRPGQEIVEDRSPASAARRPPKPLVGQEPAAIPPAEQDADHIAQPVPVDRQGPICSATDRCSGTAGRRAA